MALIAHALSLALGGRPVLDAIDLTLEPGRVTVLLGPNGAGKSSLIRCLAGLIAPQSGEATLDGEPVRAMDTKLRARRIGYLPQSAELAWNLPSRDVVALGRHPWRSAFAAPSATDAQAIDAAMALTGTQDFADRLAGELSGGERARVLLARVLAGEPEWLLADEPLASLDPAHQIDILERFAAIAHAGRGVVLVLHDLNHALRIADDIALLRAGRLVAHGPTHSVLTAEAIAQVFEIGVTVMPSIDGGTPSLRYDNRLLPTE